VRRNEGRANIASVETNRRDRDQTRGLISFSIGIAKHFALSPDEGAETRVHLGSSADVASVTGEYFHKCRPVAGSEQAQDDDAARRLWQESARLAHPEESN